MEGFLTTLIAMEAIVIHSGKALVDFWHYQTHLTSPINKNGLYEHTVIAMYIYCIAERHIAMHAYFSIIWSIILNS